MPSAHPSAQTRFAKRSSEAMPSLHQHTTDRKCAMHRFSLLPMPGVHSLSYIFISLLKPTLFQAQGKGLSTKTDKTPSLPLTSPWSRAQRHGHPASTWLVSKCKLSAHSVSAPPGQCGPICPHNPRCTGCGYGTIQSDGPTGGTSP